MGKVTVKLTGTDGNVFSIIGKVSGALKRNGQPEEAKAFVAKAMASNSYDEVLALAFETVDVI